MYLHHDVPLWEEPPCIAYYRQFPPHSPQVQLEIKGSHQPCSIRHMLEFHVESCVIDFQLKKAKKTSSISSFQDPGISTSLPVLDLVDAIKPGVVEYDMVSQGTNDEVRNDTCNLKIIAQCCIPYCCHLTKGVKPLFVREAMSHAAHSAGANPGFRSIKRLEIFLLPPEWDASPSQGPPPPQHYVAGTHLYTWVERGTMRVKCLAQEHTRSDPGRGSNSDRSIRSPVH